MAALSIVSPNKLDSGMYLTNGAGDLITPQPQQQQSQQQGSPAPAAKMSSGKRTRCSSENGQSTPELLRCKRRINFGQLGYSLPQAPPAAVARRNERERNRVKLVNMGFATLRDHVPNGAKNKKMSKVETLRSAVDYIRQLQQLLHENDSAMNTMSNASYEAAQGLSQLAEAAGLGGTGLSENCYPRSSANSGVYSQSLSPACSVASSPTPSYASDSSSYEALSPEDEELLDFTSWFS